MLQSDTRRRLKNPGEAMRTGLRHQRKGMAHQEAGTSPLESIVLDRRQWLRAGGGAAALMALAGCEGDEAPSQVKEPVPVVSPAVRSTLVETLIPALEACGFEIVDKRIAQGDTVTVYCWDKHDLQYRKKIAPGFAVLIDEYGFDSTGLETHWEDGDKIATESDQMKEFFADLHKLVERAPYISAQKDRNVDRVGAVKEDLEAPLREHFAKISVYGVEDKALYTKMAAVMHYQSVMGRVFQNDLLKKVLADPDGIGHMEEYFKIMERLCSGIDLPVLSLNDLGMAQDEFTGRMRKFNVQYETLKVVDRTNAFAKNTRAKRTAKSIVLIGGGHFETDAQLKAKMPFALSKVHTPVQMQLDSSYLVVRLRQQNGNGPAE